MAGGMIAAGTGGSLNCNRSYRRFPSNRSLPGREFRRFYPTEAIWPDREPSPGR